MKKNTKRVAVVVSCGLLCAVYRTPEKTNKRVLLKDYRNLINPKMQAISQTCRLMKTTSTRLLLVLGVKDRNSACHRTVLLFLSVCTSLPRGDFFLACGVFKWSSCSRLWTRQERNILRRGGFPAIKVKAHDLNESRIVFLRIIRLQWVVQETLPLS